MPCTAWGFATPGGGAYVPGGGLWVGGVMRLSGVVCHGFCGCATFVAFLARFWSWFSPIGVGCKVYAGLGWEISCLDI